MSDYNIKPFLKWVGGKRQLLNEIKSRMPSDFNDYYEPFVGGGALFIDLQKGNTVINDFSNELIGAYKTIKTNPLQLMKLLDKHELNHSLNPKEYYYSIRELDRSADWEKVNLLEKTARMIYLNKSCFNGLYRVNKKGFFNVPTSGREKVNTYDKDNILELSRFLNEQKILIMNGDFEKCVTNAKKGDFIFFDPPYDVLKSDTFESYTKEGFGIVGQKRLSKLAHELSEKGCYVMITNHNTPLVNELYKDFNIDVVSAKRMINSNASKRTGEETIIYNYKV